MPPLEPLNPRHLTSGLAQRTIKNLDFIVKAHASGADVHVATQTVNSLLGLLVFPYEKEKKYFKPFKRMRLGNPPNFQAFAPHVFPPLPSLEVTQFQNCGNVQRFFGRLRNAIAHRLLEFSSDSHDLHAVRITMRDRPKKDEPIDWEISMSVEDLGRLCRYVADRVIQQHL